VVPAQYDEYGFWEASATPFQLADTAISSVEQNLNSSQLKPDIEMVHNAAWSDLIGRHPGFSVFEHGSSAGTITTQFDNNWGRAPNTAPFSSGALSQVDWNINGQYHGLLVLTPNLSPVPTSLYIFTSDPGVANVIRNTHGWTTLYRQLRAGMPGVDLAVYEIGDLAQITASGSGTNDGTPVTVSIKTGSGGGVSFSTFGHPTHLQVETAREDLARLGVPGLSALGMYYASQPESGSGLANYVACLSILTAPKETVLSQWGQDVSLLDMTGFPDASMPTS